MVDPRAQAQARAKAREWLKRGHTPGCPRKSNTFFCCTCVEFSLTDLILSEREDAVRKMREHIHLDLE